MWYFFLNFTHFMIKKKKGKKFPKGIKILKKLEILFFEIYEISKTLGEICIKRYRI